MNKGCILLFIIVMFSVTIKAQDEHFSQFYAMPMHMNPALTGAYEGTYRMSAIYRDQWNNQLESPFQTFAAGGDTNIDFKIGNQTEPDKIGIGLFFVNDRVTQFQTVNNRLLGNFSYQKRLGKDKPSFLGAGVQLGITQRNINYDNLTFQDQFDQISEFDLPTGENLPPNNFGAFDFTIGINYAIDLGKTDFSAGVALHHVNQPRYSFFSKLDFPNPSIDISQRLLSRTVVHLSLNRELSYLAQIQPRIVYQQQGEHNQLDAGTNFEYRFRDTQSAFILGFWITTLSDLDDFHLENITPLVGLKQGQFIFGFSYDIHLRDILSSPFGYNTFEFSIRFSGEYEEGGAFCPTF